MLQRLQRLQEKRQPPLPLPGQKEVEISRPGSFLFPRPTVTRLLTIETHNEHCRKEGRPAYSSLPTSYFFARSLSFYTEANRSPHKQPYSRRAEASGGDSLDDNMSSQRTTTGVNRWARSAPYLAAFVVTVLWSSSYVLIKWGLEDIPPLYFATVRYALAFSVLGAFNLVVRRKDATNGAPGGKQIALLVAAGIGGYTIAQGLQFVGLFYLPAVTTSFLLNFNPFFVLILTVGLLGEGTSLAQLGGVGLALVGAWSFFSQQAGLGGQAFGILIVLASGLGWACYVVVVRMLQKSASMNSLRLTTTTMGIGVVGMVVLTVISGQYAPLTTGDVLDIVWLATANTALAFFMWNWSLKTIPAYELTVFQDLMLIEIAVFAFVFLQETITPFMVLGIALVLLGVMIVQLRGGRTRPRAVST